MGKQVQRVKDALEVSMRRGNDPKRVEVSPSVMRDLRREYAKHARLTDMHLIQVAETKVIMNPNRDDIAVIS